MFLCDGLLRVEAPCVQGGVVLSTPCPLVVIIRIGCCEALIEWACKVQSLGPEGILAEASVSWLRVAVSVYGKLRLMLGLAESVSCRVLDRLSLLYSKDCIMDGWVSFLVLESTFVSSKQTRHLQIFERNEDGLCARGWGPLFVGIG